LADVAAVLDRLAGAGPFFALDLDPPPAGTDGPAWRRFTELIDDPAALAGRVAAIRAAVAERGGLDLAQVEPRAAASLAHLGISARLVSPVIGGVLLAGVLLDLRAEDLWWRDVLGPVPLAVPGLTGRAVGSDDAAALVSALTTGPAGALVEAFAAHGVSRQVLWGNLASSVAGALTTLRQIAPGGPPAVRALGEAIFRHPDLTKAGRYESAGFRRNSCCLYYRVPGGGYCGDCVLSTPREPRSAPPPRAARASR
jgi:hypothetical protein